MTAAAAHLRPRPSLRLPICSNCGLDIGTTARHLCGACKRARTGPVALSLPELRRFVRLCRSLWTGGTPRELATSAGFRPCFAGATADPQPYRTWQARLESYEKEAASREELADYYDRLQASAGRPRRALRGAAR